MPVQSRKVTVKKQEKQKQMNRLKKMRKAINTGLIMFSTAAFIESTTKPSNVMAQTSTSARFTKQEFLDLVSDSARKIAASNDLYASVMIAQAVLESGWGNSALAKAPYHNLFGIKGHSSGETVNMDTLEDDGSGNYYVSNEAFKRYNNYAESLQDYANILTGDNGANSWRYNHYLGARKSQTTSYLDATQHLTGRYATDTSYGSKLNAIIEQNNLTNFDSVTEGTTNKPTTQPVKTGNETTFGTTSNGMTNYVIEAGDTYWSLARRFGVNVKALQNANNATNGNLYVGQSIRIPGLGNTNTNSGGTNNTGSVKEETTQQPTAPTTGQYKVVAGDSYWKLANKFGVSVAELQRLNNTSSVDLFVGQTLVVPGQQSSTQAEKPVVEQPTTKPSTTPSQTTTGQYTVVTGDTYWALAKKYNVSVDSLVALNGSNLRAGQVITIPGVSVQTPQVSAPTSSEPTQPVQTETPTNQTNGGQYTVVSGDTLWSIASRHHTTVGQLLSANGLNAHSVIVPGQTLVVNGAVTSTITSQPAATTEQVSTPVLETTVTNPSPVEEVTATTSTNGRYTVVAGDTLYSIARRLGVDVNTLVANNGGSTIISIGQTIQY